MARRQRQPARNRGGRGLRRSQRLAASEQDANPDDQRPFSSSNDHSSSNYPTQAASAVTDQPIDLVNEAVATLTEPTAQAVLETATLISEQSTQPVAQVVAVPSKLSLAFVLNGSNDEGKHDADAQHSDINERTDRDPYVEDYEFNFGDDVASDGLLRDEEQITHTPTQHEHVTETIEDEASSRARTGKTTMWLDGYKYARSNKYKTKVSYRCSHYRMPGKCDFVFSLQRYTNFVPHTCGRCVVPDRDDAPSIQRNVSDLMKREVDRLSLTMTLSRSEIWDTVRTQIYGTGEPNVSIVGLDMEYVKRRVNRVRAEEFGGSVYGQIEVSPWSQVLNDRGLASDTNFLLFHYSYYDKVSKTRERLLGWGHPVLLNMLKQKKTCFFVDGTFRSVPPKFKQCIIFTTYDRPTKGYYYPCAFVLATSKKYSTYFYAVRQVLDATDDSMDHEFVYCDFEAGLIRAMGDFFPSAATIGCLFHFKQACRRRMKKYRLGEPECKIAMKSGVLDMLTVKPQTKVEKQGIPWVVEKIKTKCEASGIRYSDSKWKSFWRYFQRTWIVRFPPRLWNIEPYTRDAVSRTNNPLERFNREMNSAIQDHTNLPDFVSGIEKLARRYANLKNDIEYGRARQPTRPPIRIPRPVALPDIEQSPVASESNPTASDADSSDDETINCLRSDHRNLVLVQRQLSRPLQLSTLHQVEQVQEPYDVEGDLDGIGSSGSDE